MSAPTLVQSATGLNTVTLSSTPTPGNVLLLWKNRHNAPSAAVQTGFTDLGTPSNAVGNPRSGRLMYRVVQGGDTTAVASDAMGQTDNTYLIEEWTGVVSVDSASILNSQSDSRPFVCGGSVTPTAGVPSTVVGFAFVFQGSNEPTVSAVAPSAGSTEIYDSSGITDDIMWSGYHAVEVPSGSYSVGGMITAGDGRPVSYCGITVVLTGDLGLDAAFSGTPVSGVAPLSVAFTDESTGSPTSWAWTFGDGGTSTAQNPTHIYTVPGYYTVSLTVTNVGGSDTETKVAYIHVTEGFTQEVYEIIPPGDDIEFVGTLEDAYQRAIRPVRNEPGSGSFTINRHSPNATETILKPGNLVRTIIPRIDGDAIFAWFMEQGDFQLVSTEEEGGEEIHIGGRGVLSYWERAVWLSEQYTVPWWDVTWGTPPTGARGHVTFEAGTYRHYTIAGGVITGYTDFTTAGFEAYFDSRQTYQWPSAGSKRFLVHIMTGETHAGWYVHPHQDGVTETLPSSTVGTSTTVLLSDISPDTPGAILYRMYQEATDPARPDQPIALMTIDFTDTLDSNGDAWATTDALAGLTATAGQDTFLDTIVQLVSTGVIDIEVTPDLLCRAFNSPSGRDLTGTTFGAGKVRFVKGVNIADNLRRERINNPVGTFMEVIGTDNATGRAFLADAATRVARELSSTADSAEEAVLEAVALARLNVQLAASDAIGFRIATGDDDATGLYLPGPAGTDHGDFWLGDTVTVHTGTGEQDFDQTDELVAAITIAEDEAGNLEVTPEVGSTLGEAERRLYDLERRAAAASLAPRSSSGDTTVTSEPALHPDLAAHDAIGLATDTELAAAVGAPSSPITMRYTFSTTTTDSDPGSGNLRLSNATQYLAVTIRADLTDSDGADVTPLLDVIAAAPTGYVRLQKRDDPTKWLVATISASASPSGYRNLTIANIAKSANSPFANGDLLLLSFVASSSGSALTVEEVDGSPTDSAVTKIVFPNGTLSIVGHVATYTPSGGGGSLTVEEVDGSPTDSAITKIVFPNGTLGIASHVATYTPAGGGGTTGIGSIDSATNPDRPPGSPSAQDDEFDAGSLDAKWTHTGAGGLTFVGSRLVVAHANSTTDELFVQAYAPGAGVAFSIAAKFSGYQFMDGIDYVGIQVLDGSNNAIAACDVRWNSGYQFNRDNPGGGASANLQQPAPQHGFYLRISRDASNVYTQELSFDGVSWSTWGIATSSSSTTVAKVAFRFGQTTARSWKVGSIDWFRRT